MHGGDNHQLLYRRSRLPQRRQQTQRSHLLLRRGLLQFGAGGASRSLFVSGRPRYSPALESHRWMIQATPVKEPGKSPLFTAGISSRETKALSAQTGIE